MADVLSQLNEDVICPICHDCFDEPKILDCLHRFCKACLHDFLVLSTAPDGPTCPECRKVIKPRIPRLSTREWADDFPTDFLVASMCDRLKRKRDMCRSHPENQVLSYCQDCRRCICHVCAAIDHRWCLGVTSLRLKAQEERECQEKYLDNLKRNEAAIENNIRKIEAEKRTLKKNHDETAIYVRAEFNSARQILEQEERQILTKLGDIMYVQQILLESEETSEACTLSVVTNEKDKVSTSLQLQSDAAFMNRDTNATICVSGGINPGSYARKTYRPVRKTNLDVIKKTLQEIVPDLTEDSHIAGEATRQHPSILLPPSPYPQQLVPSTAEATLQHPSILPPPSSYPQQLVPSTAEATRQHPSILPPPSSYPQQLVPSTAEATLQHPSILPPPSSYPQQLVPSTAEATRQHPSIILPPSPYPRQLVPSTAEATRQHPSILPPPSPYPQQLVPSTAEATRQHPSILPPPSCFLPSISSANLLPHIFDTDDSEGDEDAVDRHVYPMANISTSSSPWQTAQRIRLGKRRFPMNDSSSDSE